MITINPTKELQSHDMSLIDGWLKLTLIENKVMATMDCPFTVEGSNKIRDWCHTNLNGHWYIQQAGQNQFCMYFELGEDSLAFKLQWAG